MQAVILCGGHGTRLYPLTFDIPKCLLPLENNQTVLEYQLNYLKKYGIIDIVLAIGNLGDMVKEYIGDGKNLGLNIKYSHDNSLGTGIAVKNSIITTNINSEFILINGDTLLDVNINLLKEYHNNHNNKEKPIITIAVDSNFIPVGIYVVNPKIVNYIPQNKTSLENDIIPMVKKSHFLHCGMWHDIGTHERYNKVKVKVK